MKKTVGYTQTSSYTCLEDLKTVNELSLVSPFSLDYCGKEQCEPGHRFGPYVRESYVLHAVISGKGSYKVGGVKYEIGAGTAFLIRPGEKTVYEADHKDPWEYIWIGFHGLCADKAVEYMGFTGDIYTKKVEKVSAVAKAIERLFEYDELSYVNELRRTAILYEVFALLTEDVDGNSIESGISTSEQSNISYVRKAVQIIINRHIESIKVSDIADMIGVNRSYLSDIFKKEMGCSPKQFLTEYRLERASRYLIDTNDPIGVVAANVGYKDSILFTKAFKQKYGVTPSEYRESNATLEHRTQKGYENIFHI